MGLQSITIPAGSQFRIEGVPNEDAKRVIDWEDAGEELFKALKGEPLYEFLKIAVLRDVFSENYSEQQIREIQRISGAQGGYYVHHV